MPYGKRSRQLGVAEEAYYMGKAMRDSALRGDDLWLAYAIERVVVIAAEAVLGVFKIAFALCLLAYRCFSR